MTFTVNYNTAAATIASVAARLTMVTTSITQRNRRTNPVLF